MNHLRFLHYLEEVARVGSIRQAAKLLHVAPSAVNRRIQDLEEELGTPIFERLPKEMRLTAAGELFVDYIRARAADLARVRSKIVDLQALRRGNVKIYASPEVASFFLPAHIAQFRSQHPLVEFQVNAGSPRQALNALRSFKADVALMVIFSLTTEQDIHYLHEWKHPLRVMMHKNHPLAVKQGKVCPDELANYPVILSSLATGGRQLLDNYLTHLQTHVQPFLESNSDNFLRSYLYHEQALYLHFSIGALSDSGQLVSRDIEGDNLPNSKLVLATLKGRSMTQIGSAFTAQLTHTSAHHFAP